MDKRKKIILILLPIMILSILGITGYYWYESVNFVSTDDARINGDIVRISPQITGKLADYFIEEGNLVEKNEILGRLDLINQPISYIELSLIRAPISGIIIKKQGTVGEIIPAGQVLADMIDPEKIYITANIEETKVKNIRQGQKVDIKIDQFKGFSFTGKVDSIGRASTTTFSLLPSSSSATYTKVVQKIPVKITFEFKNKALFAVGTNADVKIHIR
jgi:multidrug resistance efflux pump